VSRAGREGLEGINVTRCAPAGPRVTLRTVSVVNVTLDPGVETRVTLETVSVLNVTLESEEGPRVTLNAPGGPPATARPAARGDRPYPPSSSSSPASSRTGNSSRSACASFEPGDAPATT
jgi:hypothetical protein